jgi:hypothetical protein
MESLSLIVQFEKERKKIVVVFHDIVRCFQLILYSGAEMAYGREVS